MGINSIGGFGGMQMDSASFAQQRFNRIDANADGGIEKSEFAKIAEEHGQNVDEVFTQFDVNEDGKLDQSEEAELFAAHKPNGLPPGGMSGPGKTGGADDTFQALLDALAESDEEDENSIQSLMQSFLQQSGAPYGNGGIFSASANMSTFSAIG